MITDVLQRFFAENATTIRSSMTRKKWSQILLRLQDRCPGTTVNEFTSEQLRNFILFEADGTPRQIAGGTMITKRTVIRSFFSWCAFASLTESDPSAVLLRTVKAKAQPTRRNYWLKSNQVSTLFDACNADSNRLRGARDGVVLGFGIFTGLRIHEIVKVRWSDLDLLSAQLFVLGKGGKAATLPMPMQLVELLLEWRGYVAQGLGRPAHHDESVLHPMKYAGFGARLGDRDRYVEWTKPIGQSGARGIVLSRGAEIGLPALAPHDLRRTFAGLLEGGKVPLREISGLLRHSSVATTEKYLADNSSKWTDSVSTAMFGISIGGGR